MALAGRQFRVGAAVSDVVHATIACALLLVVFGENGDEGVPYMVYRPAL